MNKSVEELQPTFKRTVKSGIIGKRMRHVITMNPNKANPGETLYINVPKLNAMSSLVPGSFHLLYDFKNGNAKSWFLNNLSAQLTKHLKIKIAGEIVFDNDGEADFEVYRSLWNNVEDRADLVQYGICNENLRKLISKDDSGATSGDVGKVSDALVFSINGTKMKLPLGKIMEDQGLYAPFEMMNNFQYIIKLPLADEIMVAQSGSAVEGYSLENLELEYETIENPDLTSAISQIYRTGKSLSYDHVTRMTTESWAAADLVRNLTVNLPRKSMKAVVMLFTTGAKTDSESFVYPNIENVKVTVEGVPNEVYSQGIPKTRFYGEARRLFGRGNGVTVRNFYKDKFALVIDLRTVQDRSVHNTGKKIVQTQSGVLLEITKTSTAANVTCNTYVVSDGMINIINGTLERVMY